MAVSPESQPIIGEAPAFIEMLEHVSRVAPLSKPVLVVGERGTGKELIASRLHFLSARWEQRVIKVNCAALTESILESELFGHEAGAFTGAARTHIGHFERADGGTLILDELATISLRMQEKILRTIEYGEIQRVGGNETLQVDVRIVGSTNADLQALAEDGRFRKDLLDRLVHAAAGHAGADRPCLCDQHGRRTQMESISGLQRPRHVRIVAEQVAWQCTRIEVCD